MKIIHVSDTHIVARGALLNGIDPCARLEEAVADIGTRHRDADLCVVTGDLANSGKPAEYALLAEILAGLPMPVQLLIGNHDNRAAFRESFPEVSVDRNGFVQSERVYAKEALVFLDTNEPGLAAGRYCERRLAWLRERLEEHASEGRRTMLFLHHAPVRTGIEPLDAVMLEDHAALAKAIREAGNVRYVVFGHVHLPMSGAWEGVPFSAIRSMISQTWLDFTATDAIPCSHEPPMYGVVLTNDDSIVYHAHEYADRSRKYAYGAYM